MKKVASIAVVARDGAILFLRRKDSGKWTMPGGHFEAGEDPKEAAVRELWEETGLDVEPADLESLGWGIVRSKYEVHCFKLDRPSQTVHFDNDPDEEADDHCYFDNIDSDSDYASGLPENVHVPNGSNVTLILMGRADNDGSVEIKERLAKSGPKAIGAKAVLRHLKQWDGTGGDPEWHKTLSERVSQHPNWQLGHIPIAGLETGEERNPDILDEYADMDPRTRPAIVALPSEHGMWVLDGGHRTQAAQLRGEKTILAYHPMTKMAIADLTPGEEAIDHKGEIVHDYGHLLPTEHRNKLKLHVKKFRDGPDDAGIIAHLTDDRGVIGTVTGYLDPLDGGHVLEPHSHLHPSYHGKKLGLAMYEALYTHAMHHLGVKKVRGGMHTTEASRVHEALARRHGMDYVARPAVNAVGHEDPALAETHRRGYSYVIKSEDLFEENQVLNKMAIRSLAPSNTFLASDERGIKLFDYSHLLKPEHRGKYRLQLEDRYKMHGDRAEVPFRVRLYHADDPVRVGDLNGNLSLNGNGDIDGIEPHSSLVPSHRGQGLGRTMYEALYTHMFHHHNLKQIKGGLHSNDASRVHQSLAEKHGLRYIPRPHESNRIYPNKAYSYTLKSEEFIKPLIESLTNDLRKPKYRESPNPMTGHCYVASEALYHLLGGRESGWVPHSIKHEGDQHWYLKNKTNGVIIDPTASRFRTPVPYHHGRGKGFLTKEPSKRAQQLINRIKTKMAPITVEDQAKVAAETKNDALAKAADPAVSPELKAAFDKVNPPAQVQKLAEVPKPPEDPNFVVPQQPPKWSPDGLHNYLIPIAHLESSFGKNMNHLPHAKGEYHTAFGPVGFKPVTAQEEWSKTKKLKELYPGLEDPAEFMKKFKNDWKFYNLLATSHFMRLMHRHGSPEKAAFAWRWGTGAASGATDDKINTDNYVMRYRDLSASTGVAKAERK